MCKPFDYDRPETRRSMDTPSADASCGEIEYFFDMETGSLYHYAILSVSEMKWEGHVSGGSNLFTLRHGPRACGKGVGGCCEYGNT